MDACTKLDRGPARLRVPTTVTRARAAATGGRSAAASAHPPPGCAARRRPGCRGSCGRRRAGQRQRRVQHAERHAGYGQRLGERAAEDAAANAGAASADTDRVRSSCRLRSRRSASRGSNTRRITRTSGACSRAARPLQVGEIVARHGEHRAGAAHVERLECLHGPPVGEHHGRSPDAAPPQIPYASLHLHADARQPARGVRRTRSPTLPRPQTMTWSRRGREAPERTVDPRTHGRVGHDGEDRGSSTADAAMRPMS